MHSVSLGSSTTPSMCSGWRTPSSRSLKVNPPPPPGLIDMRFQQSPPSRNENDARTRQGGFCSPSVFNGLPHHRPSPSEQCDSNALLGGYSSAAIFATCDAPRKRSPKQQCRRRGSSSKATSVMSRSPPLSASELTSERLSPNCYIFSGTSEHGLSQAEEASLSDCNVVLKPPQLRRALANLPQSAIGSQRHGPIGANVFVFHIPNEWHEKDLALQFAQFGPLLSARIATDKATGRRLGFGFVSYTNIAAACDAVEHLNGHSVAGKRLKVTIKRGEQQHAATFRCDLSTAAAPPVVHALVPPPPSPHQQQCASVTHTGWSEDIKAADFQPDFDEELQHPMLAFYSAGGDECSPYVAYEEANGFAFGDDPLRGARSSQQSTVPTASDREDSSVSDGSPWRQAVSDTTASQYKRAEHILSMLLQSGPLGSEANAEQDTCGMSWVENLALVMQSPDGARFMSSLLQLAQAPAASPSEVPSGYPTFRLPVTTTNGSDWVFDSAGSGGGEKCADQ